MLPRGTFQPGENRVSKVSVGWTNAAKGQPNGWGVLHCTDRHLILTAPRVSPFLLILLWPVLGPVGLIFAGFPGGLAAAGLLFAVSLIIPKRIVMRLPLPEASRCMLFPSAGWRRITTRDVVEITSTDGGVWRFSVLGRDRRSAAPIVSALESAGLTVITASLS